MIYFYAQRKELCQSRHVIPSPRSGWAMGIHWHLYRLRSKLSYSETQRGMAGRCLQRSELIGEGRRTLLDQAIPGKVGFG